MPCSIIQGQQQNFEEFYNHHFSSSRLWEGVPSAADRPGSARGTDADYVSDVPSMRAASHMRAINKRPSSAVANRTVRPASAHHRGYGASMQKPGSRASRPATASTVRAHPAPPSPGQHAGIPGSLSRAWSSPVPPVANGEAAGVGGSYPVMVAGEQQHARVYIDAAYAPNGAYHTLGAAPAAAPPAGSQGGTPSHVIDPSLMHTAPAAIPTHYYGHPPMVSQLRMTPFSLASSIPVNRPSTARAMVPAPPNSPSPQKRRPATADPRYTRSGDGNGYVNTWPQHPEEGIAEELHEEEEEEEEPRIDPWADLNLMEHKKKPGGCKCRDCKAAALDARLFMHVAHLRGSGTGR